MKTSLLKDGKTIELFVIWLVFGAYYRELFSSNAHGRLQACETKATSHKQLINLKRSVFTVKSKPRPCSIQFAWSMWQGLGLKFSSQDVTLG